VNVVVTNPNAESGTLANVFTYVSTAPTVSSVTPTSGPTDGGTSVTLTGGNFVAGATVTFGGTAATNVTVVNATTITATFTLQGNAQTTARTVTVTNGDGILLAGRTLYVVRNQNNLIAVVRLAPDLGSGTVTRTITNPNFDVPTTIARHGSRLYAVNARFTTPPGPTTTPTVVQVKR